MVFKLGELLENSSEIVKVLANYNKLVHGEGLAFVVIVKVFFLDTLEVFVLGVEQPGIVVELVGGLSVLILALVAELLQVVDGHQDAR